jgi:hypothetical protein
VVSEGSLAASIEAPKQSGGDPKHTEFLSVAFLDFALNRRDVNPGRVKLIFGCLTAIIALWALDMVAMSFKLLGEDLQLRGALDG